MKKITLSDIAEKTGYSVNTVSHALRDMKDISKEVKAHINDTAKKMGYIPNISAGALRGGKTMCIAFIAGDIASFDAAKSIERIGQMLQKRGYGILLMDASESAATNALSRNVDGIIALGCTLSKKNINLIKENNTPFLLASAAINRYKCGLLAGESLSRLGHRKILFLGDAGDILSGIQDTREDISICTSPSERTNCSAIVCESYDIALKEYLLQTKNGLLVPEDVSILSLGLKWDDAPFDITCVGLDGAVFCADIVKSLLDMINGEDSSLDKTLSPEFFDGETISEPSKKFRSSSRKQLSDYLL